MDLVQEHAQKAIWSLERKSTPKSPVSFTSNNPLFDNKLTTGTDDGPTSLSHYDSLDHAPVPLSSSPLKMSRDHKRKAPMSQSNFDSGDTAGSKGGAEKKFRTGPIFAATGENIG